MAVVLVLLLAAPVLAASTPVPPEAAAPVAVDPLDAEFDADVAEQPVGFPDPLESLNRRTLSFNQGIDHWVFDPLTQAYRFVVPDPARQALRRLLANLNSPRILVNDFLQGEWKGASFTITRFVVNTTVGVGGLFDPARSIGLEGHTADFGQTLALRGVGSGPYLVVPILGPTTVRDGVGSIVDTMMRPTLYLLGPADQIFYTTIHGTSEGFTQLEEHEDAIEALEESSVDYYAALRNAYYQDRVAQIWSRRGGPPDVTTGVAAHDAASDAPARVAASPTPDSALDLAGR